MSLDPTTEEGQKLLAWAGGVLASAWAGVKGLAHVRGKRHRDAAGRCDEIIRMVIAFKRRVYAFYASGFDHARPPQESPQGTLEEEKERIRLEIKVLYAWCRKRRLPCEHLTVAAREITRLWRTVTGWPFGSTFAPVPNGEERHMVNERACNDLLRQLREARAQFDCLGPGSSGSGEDGLS